MFCSVILLECFIFNVDIINFLLLKDDSYCNWFEFVLWFIGEIKIIVLVVIFY